MVFAPFARFTVGQEAVTPDGAVVVNVTVPAHPKILVSVTLEAPVEPKLKLEGFGDDILKPETSTGNVIEFPRPPFAPTIVTLYVPGARVPLAEHVSPELAVPLEGTDKFVEVPVPNRHDGPDGTNEELRVATPDQPFWLLVDIEVELDPPA